MIRTVCGVNLEHDFGSYWEGRKGVFRFRVSLDSGGASLLVDSGVSGCTKQVSFEWLHPPQGEQWGEGEQWDAVETLIGRFRSSCGESLGWVLRVDESAKELAALIDARQGHLTK